MGTHTHPVQAKKGLVNRPPPVNAADSPIRKKPPQQDFLPVAAVCLFDYTFSKPSLFYLLNYPVFYIRLLDSHSIATAIANFILGYWIATL